MTCLYSRTFCIRLKFVVLGQETTINLEIFLGSQNYSEITLSIIQLMVEIFQLENFQIYSILSSMVWWISLFIRHFIFQK